MFASKNSSGAAILAFRRYFRSSRLSAFYKIGVLKTSVIFLGKYICRSPFSIKPQIFTLKFLFEEHLFTGHLRETAFEISKN